MLHLVLYGLLAVIVAVGLFLIATRFLPAGEQIAPPLRDEPPWELPPERSLQADDVDSVRLPVALRGYRFAETDILLDRLANELRTRDEEIARLRGRVTVSLDKADFDKADAGNGHERYAPPPPTLPPPTLPPPTLPPPTLPPSDLPPSDLAAPTVPTPTGPPSGGPGPEPVAPDADGS